MKQIGGMLKESNLEMVKVKLVREVMCALSKSEVMDRTYLTIEGSLTVDD